MFSSQLDDILNIDSSMTVQGKVRGTVTILNYHANDVLAYHYKVL
jgi:hypothetical protein